MRFAWLWMFACALFLSACGGKEDKPPVPSVKSVAPAPPPRHGKTIHVVVALCDNRFQGIVPVPEKLGNGDDPANNLYWGAAYGVKTFFAKSDVWALEKSIPNPKPFILERVIFKHKTADITLVADAYRGKEIKSAVTDFCRFAAGLNAEVVDSDKRISAGGAADLVVYVGHDGLMDFSLDELPKNADGRKKPVMILACVSRKYFDASMKSAGAEPLLWTKGLMAPEAYVLKAAVDGWIANEDGEKIRRRAAMAYNTYQKCGMKAAMGLFVSGQE